MCKLMLYEKIKMPKGGFMKYRGNTARIASVFVILALILAPKVSAKGQEGSKTVILGGMPFGVSFKTGELKVGGFDDVETESGTRSPAKEAGLLKDDIIKKVDGKAPESAHDITAAVKNKGDRAVDFEIMRGEERLSLSVKPALSRDGAYRIGLLIEDGSCGLGTVTYIEKDTGRFGGLGHGIVDAKTGELCDFSKGIVTEVTVFGVNRGEVGKPGELKGDFHTEKLGAVNKNTAKGVFGYLTDYPEGFDLKEAELGKLCDVQNGGATLLCTVDKGGVCEYGIEIKKIDSEDNSGRDFLVTVTDTSLIEKTGGIVRGMSGSPIIQNGKLIGAVTHVLVNDPTRGYGIFIENMLETANQVA